MLMNGFIAAVIVISIIQYTRCTDEISEIHCGKTVGCFRLPANCKTSSCDVFITYAYKKSSDSFDITISSKHKWAAFALGKELHKAKMAGMKGEVCVENNGVVQLLSLNASKNGSPDFKTPSKELSIRLVTKKEKRVFCKYSRKARVNDIKDFITTLDTKVYAIYAYGDKIRDNYPGYHGYGNYGYTNKAIDLKSVMLA
ncbi:uncharacterized protein LOC100209978 [Hydra vulgaris]|uniref:uncharacterized protein LOC100209978 n=1 Tax=Hydra vulgaris TaxID=6087 RepID=UPI001F5F68F9|nr:uncharacterized protein LOC100209978 [Hydra vulgaris]